MKCPVCHQNLDLTPKQLKQDLYYDCNYCSSSLFFKEGQCQILAEGSVMASEQEKEVTSQKTQISNNETSNDIMEESQNFIDEPEVTKVPELFADEVDSHVEEAPFESDTDEVDSHVEEAPFESDTDEADSHVEEAPSESDTLDSNEYREQSENRLTEDQEEDSEKVDETPRDQEGDSEKVDETPRDKEDSPQRINESPESSLEDFSEVTAYGNRALSIEEGTLYYNLNLSDINSKELHSTVLDILSDESLQLKPETNSLEITDGVLKIVEISPVKAHIIVKSLIGLPIKISWEQHLSVDKT